MLDPRQPDPSAELVRAAQHGEPGCVDELVRRSLPRLQRLVRARLGPELRRFEESADVVQSSLLVMVRGLPRFEYRGPGSFLRWLTGLVEHRIRRHLRDSRRQKRNRDQLATASTSSLPDTSAGPDQAAEHRDLEGRYQQALCGFAPAARELLQLYLDRGCTFQEIASARGLVSADAARKRVDRLLARLQRRMGAGP